jgi:hypothetical protein
MEDYLPDGQPKRRQKRIRLAPLDTKWRTVLRLRDEKIKPLNQGLLAWGSATDFTTFVQQTYIPSEMPLLAKPRSSVIRECSTSTCSRASEISCCVISRLRSCSSISLWA